MPRAKLVDNTGRFIVPIVYRLRTAEGDAVEVTTNGAGDPSLPPISPPCPHCGQLLPVRPEPDLVGTDGAFIGTVKEDTREQTPFDFSGIGWDAQDGGGEGKTITVPVQRGTLRSGDYSLLGFETKVAVERKSLSDLYSTIAQGRDRFERELARLADYQFAAVVIESDWATICSSPPPRTRLPPKTVFRSILAWQQRFPRVHWMPAGTRRLAEVTTFRMLERFLREEIQRGSQRDAAA